jgi:hypothetical protein
MFQVTRRSLVLIAFVWGALVNGGIQMGTLVVARIYKGAPYTYYSQRLPYEMADCSPSELEFYAMIFIMTHWLTA